MSSSTLQRELSSTTYTPEQHASRGVYAGLAAILVLYCGLSCIGITWGLPSRSIDKYLFGDGEVWSGEKIYRLAHAGEKLSDTRISTTGADVDVNPISRASGQPVFLTATDEDIARIYLRYRLYTYQPDEMITMMALAGMRPGEGQFDPRLYQYGGLFIYPVGALIKLCGILGLIDVRSDIVFYLDNPDEFGKFYIVARAYSAAWGLVGVIVVFALTRRVAYAIRNPGTSERQREDQGSNIEDRTRDSCVAGLIAAIFFTLMPVVVCMSHEGKPHLPGAVLMLLGVYLATQAVSENRKFFWLMCVCCGAAVGMVLSSWPICVLILLAAILQYRRSNIDRGFGSSILKIFVGGLAAIAVYFATNPYVLINLFTNREILRSNFGNSLAMYDVARIGEGFVRVLELIFEGTAFFPAALGIAAIIVVLMRGPRPPVIWLVLIPAALFFLQFVLIGAGKPAEYGRFAIFPNTVLIIAAAALSAYRFPNWLLVVPASMALAMIGCVGVWYATNFYVDTSPSASRIQSAHHLIYRLSDAPPGTTKVVVPVEPAPYSCPPLNFAATDVLLAEESMLKSVAPPFLMVHTEDKAHSTPISWANKTIWVRPHDTPRTWYLPYRKPVGAPSFE